MIGFVRIVVGFFELLFVRDEYVVVFLFFVEFSVFNVCKGLLCGIVFNLCVVFV